MTMEHSGLGKNKREHTDFNTPGGGDDTTQVKHIRVGLITRQYIDNSNQKRVKTAQGGNVNKTRH